MNTATVSKEATPSAAVAFQNVLSGMKRGEVLSDLDEALKDIVQAVQATGKPGTITLKLKISPDGESNNQSPLYKVEDDISIKKPRKGRGPSRFFGDEEGNLLRNDPKQTEMKFEEIAGGKTAETPATPAESSAATQAQ